MQIVIDISEETYNEVCWRGLDLCPRGDKELVNAIKNGTPLPKGVDKAKSKDGVDKSQMIYEIYMAGVNVTGVYKGRLVRFEDIEKIVNKYLP